MISGMFAAAKKVFQKLKGAPAPKRGESYLASALASKSKTVESKKKDNAPAALVRALRDFMRRRAGYYANEFERGSRCGPARRRLLARERADRKARG